MNQTYEILQSFRGCARSIILFGNISKVIICSMGRGILVNRLTFLVGSGF